MTFHLRVRLTARGGNQYYRDLSERKAETVCGAPVTEWDVLDSRYLRSFAGRTPCKECVAMAAGVLAPVNSRWPR